MKNILNQLLQSLVMLVYSGGLFIAAFMRCENIPYDEIIPVCILYYVIVSVVTVFVVAWWDKRH